MTSSTSDGSGLTGRISRIVGDGPAGRLTTKVVGDLGTLDRAVYAAVAEVPTPTLDERLRQLSLLADNSKLWFGIAGATALLGGRRGRQAALDGVIAIGLTSLIVNQPLKRLLPRDRPDRELHGVLTDRHVPLPTSPSFPSGHSASAFAFANALGGEMPWAALPVRFLAAAVAWSRVHTGVHYPGDVIAGALIGGAVGEVVGTVRRRLDDQQADPGGAIRQR
jgi:membrane-associated phospholipid phosphatase